MTKSDKPVINISGDNNKVYLGESKSHLSAAIVLALGVIAGAAVLAVSHCCPELLAEFVRLVFSIAINS